MLRWASITTSSSILAGSRSKWFDLLCLFDFFSQFVCAQTCKSKGHSLTLRCTCLYHPNFLSQKGARNCPDRPGHGQSQAAILVLITRACTIYALPQLRDVHRLAIDTVEVEGAVLALLGRWL